MSYAPRPAPPSSKVVDFLIIGSTPMANPAQIFGNPRPSARVLQKGDITNMELAAGYRGYTAQIGSPICLGEPTEMVRKLWEDITLPGYRRIVAEIAPGKPAEAMRQASKFFRDKPVAPDQVHGIDLVTDKPHVVAEHVSAEKFEEVLKSGMVIAPWRHRGTKNLKSHPSSAPRICSAKSLA
jgi:Xaa-Pro aminopeptidase